MKLACLFGRHKRSGGFAKFNDTTKRWESICKHCGKFMVRLGRDDWRLATKVKE